MDGDGGGRPASSDAELVLSVQLGDISVFCNSSHPCPKLFLLKRSVELKDCLLA
jgi:hypothetical protein